MGVLPRAGAFKSLVQSIASTKRRCRSRPRAAGAGGIERVSDLPTLTLAST